MMPRKGQFKAAPEKANIARRPLRSSFTWESGRVVGGLHDGL